MKKLIFLYSESSECVCHWRIKPELFLSESYEFSVTIAVLHLFCPCIRKFLQTNKNTEWVIQAFFYMRLSIYICFLIPLNMITVHTPKGFTSVWYDTSHFDFSLVMRFSLLRSLWHHLCHLRQCFQALLHQPQSFLPTVLFAKQHHASNLCVKGVNVCSF